MCLLSETGESSGKWFKMSLKYDSIQESFLYLYKYNE